MEAPSPGGLCIMVVLRIHRILEGTVFCVTLRNVERGFPRMIFGGFALGRRTRLFLLLWLHSFCFLEQMCLFAMTDEHLPRKRLTNLNDCLRI